MVIVVDDTLREANSYLHRAWYKIKHQEFKDAEYLLDLAEKTISKAKKEVKVLRKQGGE